MPSAVRLGVAASLLVHGAVAGLQVDGADRLGDTLARAAARVERFLERAQSIVCLETVRVQPLGIGLSPDGFARTVESELRLSWDQSDEEASTEAQTLRQVLRVNGHPPRPNDPHNCTSPEQTAVEPQPLSLLLAAQRDRYAFALAGTGRVDRRAAIMIDYRLKQEPTVDVKVTDTNEDCISFSIEGGLRGRIWLDAESYDVLRIDQRLSGLVEIPMPPAIIRRGVRDASWTVERLDTSIRFARVAFENPSETLTLPVSVSALRVTRGAGTPRVRMTTEYSGYKRFLTDARIIKE